MKKVLIAGTFDIIHPGHLNLIKQARSLGNFLIAVVGRDRNVVKVKGNSPFFNENQRLNHLKKLDLIDKVLLGDLDDPYKVIKEEKPDVVALGYDQQVYAMGLHDLLINSNLSYQIERLEPFKEDVCKGKNVRNAIEDSQAGFLLINKEEDWTSHDVVAKLRSITGIKSIGHTGTLDPFATGLLICAISKATKLVGIFDLLAKTYEATVRLGVVSDTYDRTGKIEDLRSKIVVSEGQILEVLKSFIVKQKQVPPMYSAKKVGGRKLYELARKGEEVERKASEIEIYGIDELRSKIDLSSEVRRTKEEDRRSETSSGWTYCIRRSHRISLSQKNRKI